MANVLAVAADISIQGNITPGPTPTVTLVVGYRFLPADGSDYTTDSVPVSGLATLTAAQWRQAIIDAIKTKATQAGHTIVRLIGLIDIATVANP